jgi:hypothetical protein
MPWWGYICVAAACIVVFSAAVVNGIIIAIIMRNRPTSSWLYNLKARRHNKKARALRLDKTNYFGYPLPTGTSGELIITREMQTKYPISFRHLERIMLDRADDLGVDLFIYQEPLPGDIVVRWSKSKRRKR